MLLKNIDIQRKITASIYEDSINYLQFFIHIESFS